MALRWSLGLMLLAAGPVLAQESAWPGMPGFTFCAIPIRPACVDASVTYRSNAATLACQQGVERYVRTVFAYRQCLNVEMERAVRQTNETLGLLRCRASGAQTCP